MSEINPGLLLIVGALLIPFLPGIVRSVYMLALPIVAFLYLLGQPIGELGQIQLFDMTLTTLRQVCANKLTSMGSLHQR